MINYLEILRPNHLGYSQRTIRSFAHCSGNTVRSVLAEVIRMELCAKKLRQRQFKVVNVYPSNILYIDNYILSHIRHNFNVCDQ